GRAVLYVDVEEKHLNRGGTLRGGVHARLIDSAMSLSLIALTNSKIATTQMNVHFLGPVREGRMSCRGEVLRRTRRTATAEGRVYDGAGNLVAMGAGSFRIFAGKARL
ncbi:MAG: PaaI family thioesterase, partial [Rubrobacter sp.]|nr:PaaI family thioesterase [Rubrobacter sp.]